MEPEPKMEEPLPAQTPPPSQPSAVPAQTDGIAAQVAAEHSAGPGNGPGATMPGKKPGRPPIHGAYSKAAGSDGKNPVKIPVAFPGEGPAEETEVELRRETRVVVPPQLRDRIIKKTLTLAETATGTLIAGEAKKAGLTEQEIAPQMEQTKLGEDNKQIVADLTPYVLQEWGIDDPEISPTLAVGLVLGPWLLGSTTAYLTLASLAKERLEMEKAKKREQTPEETK